ncbi:MAG: YggS family pyridoxal phosphate-dependent enzyme [Alphaproteobacteria bacterium]|nr:YggS family pyridoxal phosphate-dependent enzyme [Alphaproteobacteria bacterium]
MTDDAAILRAYDDVRARIDRAARDAGRDPGDVSLVAVTKTFEADAIEPVLARGHRMFGENRVQEAMAKWPALRARYADIALHLIGPLQTNKVHEAAATFDVIETLDRPKLARALAAEFERVGRSLPLFVQVNTGEEPQKAGVPPRETLSFVRQCREEWRLDIRGLMCIPPIDEEPSLHFALLSDLAKEAGVPSLSMGMSGDFEVAVRFGASHVRVGSAIFGTRTITPQS